MKKILSVILSAAMAVSLVACGGTKITEMSVEPEVTLEKGGEYQLEAIFKASKELDEAKMAEATAALELEFVSSNEEVATVDEGGLVTAVDVGEAEITVSVKDQELSATCKVTVENPVKDIEVPEELEFTAGDEAKKIEAKVIPEDAVGYEIQYESSDEKIATVDEDGNVTPVAEGECIIKITAHKAGTCDISLAISDVNASCKVTVKKAASKPTASNKSSAASAQNTSAPAPAEASAPEAQSNNASAAAPAAPASGGSSEPTPGSGHAVWTVVGDPQARPLMNDLRASLGLGQLSWSDSLGDVAAERCKQLMVDFSHNGMTAPEICAMNTPDAASTVAAWTGSSAHYAVMTNPSFTQVGIAHFYDGDGCHYWCACFG